MSTCVCKCTYVFCTCMCVICYEDEDVENALCVNSEVVARPLPSNLFSKQDFNNNIITRRVSNVPPTIFNLH